MSNNNDQNNITESKKADVKEYIAPSLNDITAMPSYTQIKKIFNKDLSVRDKNFKPDDIIISQMRIDDEENIKIQNLIKEGIKEGLNKIEKESYDRAYSLGKTEGTKKAYEEKKQELENILGSLKTIIDDLLNFRSNMAKTNENYLVKLTYLIAEVIVNEKIAEKPMIVKNVIEKAIKFAVQNEKIVVKVSFRDFEYASKIKEELLSKNNNLNNLSFEVDKNIENGGCIIETNFSKIDASIKTMFNKFEKYLKLNKDNDLLDIDDETVEKSELDNK